MGELGVASSVCQTVDVLPKRRQAINSVHRNVLKTQVRRTAILTCASVVLLLHAAGVCQSTGRPRLARSTGAGGRSRM
jgi:hypothetical protein